MLAGPRLRAAVRRRPLPDRQHRAGRLRRHRHAHRRGRPGDGHRPDAHLADGRPPAAAAVAARALLAGVHHVGRARASGRCGPPRSCRAAASRSRSGGRRTTSARCCPTSSRRSCRSSAWSRSCGCGSRRPRSGSTGTSPEGEPRAVNGRARSPGRGARSSCSPSSWAAGESGRVKAMLDHRHASPSRFPSSTTAVVLPASGKPVPALFTFNWLSATGTRHPAGGARVGRDRPHAARHGGWRCSAGRSRRWRRRC